MKMVSVKRTAADKKREKEKYSGKGSAIGGSEDDVPYGLHVRLDHETMQKLGLHTGKLPKTGSKLKMHALAHVHSTSDSTRDGKTERSMELHLHHMALERPTNEEIDIDARQGAKKAMDRALDEADDGENE